MTLEMEGIAIPEKAGIILVCVKLLAAELMEKAFLDPEMKARWHFGSDEGNYHTMYIAEIEKVLVKE